MRIAFYAPLKAPDHPTPSGDREIARLLVKAFEHAGHRVHVASTLRAYEGRGDRHAQHAIRDSGAREAGRLIDSFRREGPPDLWLTYHVYHKAPDWIGPAVCDALDLPYAVAEASVSPRAARGPWAAGHERAVACIRRADVMLAINPRDIECAAPYLGPGRSVVRIRPFVENREPPHVDEIPTRGSMRMVAVGMMRPGDKQRSWTDLAGIIRRLPDGGWCLDTVGDGEAAAEVRSLLDSAGAGRVRHHGRLDAETRDRVLDRCDLALWPARNEALGMALLEAQARGLAIVAGREGGVPSVVYHGLDGLLYPPGDLDTAADHVRYLIEHREVLNRMRRTARECVNQRHRLDDAARQLDRVIRELCVPSS